MHLQAAGFLFALVVGIGFAAYNIYTNSQENYRYQANTTDGNNVYTYVPQNNEDSRNSNTRRRRNRAKDSQQDECIICYDPLTSETSIVMNCCENSLHQGCLKKWKDSQISNTCPLCRSAL